jgi:NAD(P)-dependent dehydrogenase (short-subunit alcohol dehydrogenase family)
VKLGLEGQVVLMTGVTSGMGPEIAQAFAEEGAVLGLLTRRPEAVAEMAAELAGASVFACDITDADSCDAAPPRPRRSLGRPTR